MAVEVIVGFDRAHDIRVYDCARAAVPLPVAGAIRDGEEYYLVFLGNDNKCNRGVEIQFCTSVYGLAVVRRQERSLGARTRGKEEKAADGPRMKLISSLITVLNSPSETPSWETFVILRHDIGQKPGLLTAIE